MAWPKGKPRTKPGSEVAPAFPISEVGEVSEEKEVTTEATVKQDLTVGTVKESLTVAPVVKASLTTPATPEESSVVPAKTYHIKPFTALYSSTVVSKLREKYNSVHLTAEQWAEGGFDAPNKPQTFFEDPPPLAPVHFDHSAYQTPQPQYWFAKDTIHDVEMTAKVQALFGRPWFTYLEGIDILKLGDIVGMMARGIVLRGEWPVVK
jgi:hypothetical protein